MSNKKSSYFIDCYYGCKLQKLESKLEWNCKLFKTKKEADEFIKDESMIYKTLSIPCFYGHDDYLPIVKNMLRHKLSFDVSVEIEKEK